MKKIKHTHNNPLPYLQIKSSSGIWQLREKQVSLKSETCNSGLENNNVSQKKYKQRKNKFLMQQAGKNNFPHIFGCSNIFYHIRQEHLT